MTIKSGSYGEICCLLIVHDHITGTSFLVDNGDQISLISVMKGNRVKGHYKFTLQTVNKSLIQTYEPKYLSLYLGLH